MNRVRTATASALALGIVLVGPALSAAADTGDVENPNLSWFEVDDQGPTLGALQSNYHDLLSSGAALPFGWTADAISGLFTTLTVDDSIIHWVPQPGGAGWVDGGLSSFRYAGTYGSSDGAIDATLEIQGNYARWTFTPVSGAVGTFEASGSLAMDDVDTVVAANSAVVASDANDADSVLGFWFDGASGTLDVGDAAVAISAQTSAPATFIVAAQDFAPCAKHTAENEMIARVSSLDATFGESIAGALECARVAPPTGLVVDAPTSQTLAVTIDPLVDTWMADPWQLAPHGAYLADPELVGHAFAGGVPGVSFGFDPATAEVTMTGTPTAAGTFDVTLVLYLTDVEDYWDGEPGTGYPLVASLTIDVTEPTLAETGTDVSAAVALGLGVTVAGLVTLLVGALHRRRNHARLARRIATVAGRRAD